MLHAPLYNDGKMKFKSPIEELTNINTVYNV